MNKINRFFANNYSKVRVESEFSFFKSSINERFDKSPNESFSWSVFATKMQTLEKLSDFLGNCTDNDVHKYFEDINE